MIFVYTFDFFAILYFTENMDENPEPEMVFVKEELEPLLMLNDEPDKHMLIRKEEPTGEQTGRH